MRILKNAALLVAVVGMVFTSSCTKDPCADVSCSSTGVCVDGTCDCDEFYEGGNCATEMRTKFYGNYLGTMTANGSAQNVTMALTEYHGKVQRVWIDGDFYFDITGSTTGEIPLQLVNSNGTTINITGTVSLNNNAVQINMTWTANGQNIAVIIQATK